MWEEISPHQGLRRQQPHQRDSLRPLWPPLLHGERSELRQPQGASPLPHLAPQAPAIHFKDGRTEKQQHTLSLSCVGHGGSPLKGLFTFMLGPMRQVPPTREKMEVWRGQCPQSQGVSTRLESRQTDLGPCPHSRKGTPD